MPVSPFKRAVDEGLAGEGTNQKGSSTSRRKRKSKPTSKARAKKQKTKDRYAHAREDAQLEGLIPTTPEEALADERSHSVDPLDGLPELVRQALREQWTTPAQAKPAILAALLRPFFNEVPVFTKEGELVMVPPSPKLLNELARTILALDQTQWERDNPLAAGQAKGGATVSVSLQANVLAASVLREALERDEGGGRTALPAPTEPCPPGHSRFDGEVEVGAASTSDQQGAG